MPEFCLHTYLTHFITMKKLLLPLLGMLFSVWAHAQTATGPLTIKGAVIDSATSKPLGYVTVAVQDAQTHQPVKSTLSKDDGSFELVKLPAKSYQLALAFVGYQTKFIKINAGNGPFDAGRIKLSLSTNQLKEVSVTAVKPILKQELDRLGYNVQNDPEVKSLSVLDMMRKVPMLSVDGNNNIKLRGNDNYKILINGKESALVASNPSDVLKAMPASNIEKIEVITTPPAKYDAEGLAGIINIITKKNADQGYNGNISARYNTIWGPGINLNATVKQGKFGVNGYVGYNRRNNLSSPFENSTTTFNPASGLMQSGSRSNGGHNTYGSAELSYEADSLNLITGAYNFYGGSNRMDMSQLTTQTDATDAIIHSYRQVNGGSGDYGGYDASLNYQLGFKRSKEQLLTLSYKYSSFSNKQFTDAMFDQLYNYQHDNYQQYNKSGSREQTFQLDYAHPLKKLSIEAGGKAILRNNYSNFHNDVFNTSTDTYVTDPAQTNNFNYHQNILNLYNTYALKLEKWAFKGGLRLEHTKVDADFSSNNSTVNQNYNNLIPSLSIQRSFKTSSITAGYTQRIQRPGIWQLNPFVDSSNVQYQSQGNPNLRPAINNNFELNYSNFAIGSVNVSLNYTYAAHTVQSITTIIGADNVSFTTYQNAGSRKGLGLDASTNYPLSKKINLNINAEILQIWIKGTYNGAFISNSGLQGHAFTYTDYKIKDGFKVGLNVGFDSRYVLLQGVDNYYLGYGVSSSKDVLKGKGTINLSVGNPFSKFNILDFYTRTPDFYTVTTNYNYYRNFFIGFTYKFGKLNASIKKSQKGIQNDDVSNSNGH